ncbi:Hypothetical protein FKW44_006117 [Caligus rogercresseyi]|uniref:Uncharacterized protein n=1 Tax=Caligus rogercresseyi TaxID=217165 RepID=A0A7T8KCX0_CALRO|nr:Hypothetical protein FKW44_006117 [Caligus rogercresseyi]
MSGVKSVPIAQGGRKEREREGSPTCLKPRRECFHGIEKVVPSFRQRAKIEYTDFRL